MYEPDCICIVESWLSGDIHDSEFCIDGNDIICLDCNRHGGGVLLFINSVFTHHAVFTGRHELELVIVLLSVSLTIALFLSSSWLSIHNFRQSFDCFVHPY